MPASASAASVSTADSLGNVPGEMPSEPGPIARRWEALSAPVRFLIVFVISSPILWLVHVTWLNQPEDRGVFYGIFWGVVAGLIMLLATRSEKMKREGLDSRRARRRDASLSVPDRPDELFVVVDDAGRADRHGDARRLPLGPVARPPVGARGRARARRRASGSCAGYDKDSAPSTWDHACSGHVSAGESVREAAVRELAEEVGIDVARRRSRGARAGALRARRRDRADDGLPRATRRPLPARARPSSQASSCCRRASVPRRCRPRARCSPHVLDTEHPGWDG